MSNNFTFKRVSIELTEGTINRGFTFTETKGYLIGNHPYEKDGVNLVIHKGIAKRTKTKWQVSEMTTGYLCSSSTGKTRQQGVEMAMDSIRVNSNIEHLQNCIKSKLDEINFFKETSEDK